MGQGQEPVGGPGSSADQEGPLSAKTKVLLGCRTDGSLPEPLDKLDTTLVETICHDIKDAGAAVQWDDIAGQDQAKELIQEMVVWPMLNPAIFTGARAPPKGILLFGPPGTGKTLLGKAIATNIAATFFSI